MKSLDKRSWLLPWAIPPRYLNSIITGILCGTSYIPFPPWAIFFCFVPLWSDWINETKTRNIFWTGWVAQFFLTLIGFNWVTYTVHEFGHFPWPFAVIVMFGFASFANLHLPLAGVAWHLFSRKFRLNQIERIILLPIFYGAAERLYPMVFDWHYGYTWLWAGFPAFQLADIIGFFGLSTVGLAFNAMILISWIAYRRARPWKTPLLIVILIFLILNLAGYWHGPSHIEPPTSSAKFLLIQPNIGNQEKLMAEQGWNFKNNVLEKLSRLTREGLYKANNQVDFAVWPETAFPDLILDPQLQTGYAARLRQQVESFGIPLITGGYSRLDPTREITNSFFILDRNGHVEDRLYHKSILLAFGEYLPGSQLYPRLRTWLPEVGEFGRGGGPTVLSLDQLRIGPQICYEGLFDWFSRVLARKGAQVIVNITNDSWYGPWQQPYQHLYMTLARAIEVRLPVVRATNTGISSVILADGTILERSALQQAGNYLYDVPYDPNPKATIFMSWGYWLMPVLMLITFFATVIWSRSKSEKS